MRSRGKCRLQASREWIWARMRNGVLAGSGWVTLSPKMVLNSAVRSSSRAEGTQISGQSPSVKRGRTGDVAPSEGL